MKAADAGLAELEATSTRSIVILNDQAARRAGRRRDAGPGFAHANDVLRTRSAAISDIIHFRPR